MMKKPRFKRPSTNGRGANGQRVKGRFTLGNSGGPGNPFADRIQSYRKVFFEAVSADDLYAIIRRVVGLAKVGDIAAAKVILERALGRVEIDLRGIINAGATYDPDERFL
jgi:hypothetical protein